MGRITRIGVPQRMHKAVDKWSDDIIKDVKRVVRETAFMLERELKLLMPEDTGEMKDSITVEIGASGLSAKLRVGAFYAIYVNYGSGIYAEGPGGSRAKKIPWTYYNERWRQWVTTYGQRPQYFWERAIPPVARFFTQEMNKIGK